MPRSEVTTAAQEDPMTKRTVSIEELERILNDPNATDEAEVRADGKVTVSPRVRMARRWQFRAFFAWYDLWIGAYIDVGNRRVYVCPLPCVVLMVQWPEVMPWTA